MPDTQRLVHELRVHQIELEMQNEELRRAQHELEVSREKYFDLYDLAPVGYLTLNEPGLILEANLTATRLLGVARTDLLQQPLTRFILREHLDIFYQHRQQLFETGAPQSCELRLTRPGGAPFWVRGEAILAQDHKTGAPVCRMMLSDLTERKQAEADRERLAQFERLAQLMKCASDIVLLADEHGRILEANDRALEIYGYSLAELRQKTLEDLRTPESRAELPHQIEQLETDGRGVFEAMNQRRDGTAFPVEISARVLEIAGVRHRLGIVRDITERKWAEAALRESETRFRELFSHMSSGVAVYEARNDGQDFVFKDFNRAAERIEATPREAVLGRSVVEVFPGVKEFGLFNVLQRVWRTGQPEHPATGLHRDKHIVGWRENQVYRLPNGEIVAVYDDITQRQRAEAALRESEETMRYMVKYDPNAIAIYDLNLHYLAVSDRYLQDYNVKEENVIGKHHYEVFPELPQRWKDVHQRCLSGAIERNDDDYFERPDGSITYNRWECRPWYRGDGTIGGMITYTEVTTERKKAEIALRESERRHRAILRTALDGFWRVGLRGHLLEVNEAYCRMSGYSEQELLTMHTPDLEAVEAHADTAAHLQRVLARGEDRFETRHRRKDGSTFAVEISVQYKPAE
jgi:PAS domain S-box-containing protein